MDYYQNSFSVLKIVTRMETLTALDANLDDIGVADVLKNSRENFGATWEISSASWMTYPISKSSNCEQRSSTIQPQINRP